MKPGSGHCFITSADHRSRDREGAVFGVREHVQPLPLGRGSVSKHAVRCCVSLAVLAMAMGWTVAAVQGQATTAPVAPPTTPELAAIVPDLASPDVARREVGQTALEKIPAERFEEVTALAAQQTDPEVKARLEKRTAEMLDQLAGKSTPVPLRAKALVAKLMAMPDFADDPQRKMNPTRQQLIRDIGALGDPALAPALAGLKKATTPVQREELVDAIGTMTTPDATKALLGFLPEKDEAVRNRIILALANHIASPMDQGGSDDVLPTLAKTLPDAKNEGVREVVCSGAKGYLQPWPAAGKPDATRGPQAAAMLRERLKNDSSAQVRLYAALGLTEFGDKSGLAELEKDALALQASGNGTLFAKGETEYFWVESVVSALEKDTRQQFMPPPAAPDNNARLSPTLPIPGPVLGKSGDPATQKARLELAVTWIKAHPSTQPDDMP